VSTALRATLPMTVGSCALAMVDNGETNGLITPPPRWVSIHNYYTLVSLHDSDHDSVVRIFVALSCKLWDYLHTIRSGCSNWGWWAYFPDILELYISTHAQ